MSALTEPVGVDTWLNNKDGSYGNGGICRLEDVAPHNLVMKLTIDEHFCIHGGTYAAPEPLRTALQELIDQIRSEVDRYRRQSELSGRPSREASAKSGDREDWGTAADQEPPAEPERDGPGHGAAKGSSPTQTSLKRPRRVSKHGRRSQGADEALADSSEDRETDKEERDDELYKHTNLRQIALSDDAALRDFYYAAFKRIQQTHCRQIAQTLVKVVHPKKQTRHPYNGARRAINGGGNGPAGNNGNGKGAESKNEGGDTRPDWWPAKVPHREPAHMKTPERMELLMHILCNLRKTPDTGPRGKGVCVADLQEATDEMKADKLPKKARSWLAHIYEARRAQEQYEDGCMREAVSVHMPSNKRIRKKDDRSRAKMESDLSEDDVARFEDEADPAARKNTAPETFQRFTRSGEVYQSSESDDDSKFTDIDSSSESYSTKASDRSLAFGTQQAVTEKQVHVTGLAGFPSSSTAFESSPRVWDRTTAPPTSTSSFSQGSPQHLQPHWSQAFTESSRSANTTHESHKTHVPEEVFQPLRIEPRDPLLMSQTRLPNDFQQTSSPFWMPGDYEVANPAGGQRSIIQSLPPISPAQDQPPSWTIGRSRDNLPSFADRGDHRSRIPPQQEQRGPGQPLVRFDSWNRSAAGPGREDEEVRLAPLRNLSLGSVQPSMQPYQSSQHGRYIEHERTRHVHWTREEHEQSGGEANQISGRYWV